jgi:hypothetical protein
MIFLTYNDNYSGIYKSQVVDVCSFIQKEFLVPIKLIAFVSIRSYSTHKKLIKSNYSNAVVLPMFPKVRLWKLNTITLFLVCLFSGERKVWARGAFAANMATSLKNMKLVKSVLFDVRGAYQAELTEYNVVADSGVVNSIEQIEKNALIKSNAQLVVSNKLVEWWKVKYNYTPGTYATIPCTLSDYFCKDFTTETEWLTKRESMGYSKDDIVLVYSGSSAGWQSFKLVDEFLYHIFSSNSNVKLIFLSNEVPKDSKVFQAYSDRISTKWVKPEEVSNILTMADYGLLIREASITNQVASPVKFAEYLACGLQVIISEGIGDFTNFVKEQDCGLVFSKDMNLEKVPFAQKIKNNQLARHYFLKESDVNKQAYKKLIDTIN